MQLRLVGYQYAVHNSLLHLLSYAITPQNIADKKV